MQGGGKKRKRRLSERRGAMAPGSTQYNDAVFTAFAATEIREGDRNVSASANASASASASTSTPTPIPIPIPPRVAAVDDSFISSCGSAEAVATALRDEAVERYVVACSFICLPLPRNFTERSLRRSLPFPSLITLITLLTLLTPPPHPISSTTRGGSLGEESADRAVLEWLKAALMARGAKAGGTASQRAERLWAVQGLKADEIPKKMRARK